MDQEMKETVLKAVDYTSAESEKCNKRVRLCNAVAMLLLVFYMITRESAIYQESSVVMAAADIAQGMALGMLLVGLIFSSRYGAKVRAFKRRILHK